MSFGTLDLHTTWFVLVGVLFTGYVILDGFDLGVGVLHLFVAKRDEERRVFINAIGPVWDGNEVWLVTGGGALFAAFPAVYATVFSGFYLAFMALLCALIFRAVAIEFRSKHPSPRWRCFWDRSFALITLALWAAWSLWRGTLENSRALLWLLVISVLGPQIANQAGWWTAEVGRQPWIVYKLLRTSQGLSAVVHANQIVASLIMFTLVYLLLFAAFVFLLNEKIRHGPDETDLQPTGKLALGFGGAKKGAS